MNDYLVTAASIVSNFGAVASNLKTGKTVLAINGSDETVSEFSFSLCEGARMRAASHVYNRRAGSTPDGLASTVKRHYLETLIRLDKSAADRPTELADIRREFSLD